MSSVLRIYSQIYLKLLQTKKTRAFYVFIKVYLYEQTEKRSGFVPLRNEYISYIPTKDFNKKYPIAVIIATNIESII